MRHWILGLLAFGLVGTAQAGTNLPEYATTFAFHLDEDADNCNRLGPNIPCIMSWHAAHQNAITTEILYWNEYLFLCDVGIYWGIICHYASWRIAELNIMGYMNDGWAQSF